MSDDAEGLRVQELLRASCPTVRARNHADVAAYLFGPGEEAEAEGFLAAAHDESRRAESQVWMERGTERYEREIEWAGAGSTPGSDRRCQAIARRRIPSDGISHAYSWPGQSLPWRG